MTDVPSAASEAETGADTDTETSVGTAGIEDGAVAAPGKLSKPARLEAKAARLREREELKATQREDAAGRGSRRWRWWAIGLAVGLVVVLATTIPYALHERSLSSSKARALATELRVDAIRRTVVADATQYAIDFGSYDYQSLSADFKKVASHLTPAFAKSYSSVSAQLQSTIVQYKGKSTAAVQGVAVADVTQTTAMVLVFLDQTVTTTQSSTARIDRNRLLMTLQRQPDGSWLISDLVLK